jgi:hypothetical protein
VARKKQEKNEKKERFYWPVNCCAIRSSSGIFVQKHPQIKKTSTDHFFAFFCVVFAF